MVGKLLFSILCSSKTATIVASAERFYCSQTLITNSNSVKSHDWFRMDKEFTNDCIAGLLAAYEHDLSLRSTIVTN